MEGEKQFLKVMNGLGYTAVGHWRSSMIPLTVLEGRAALGLGGKHNVSFRLRTLMGTRVSVDVYSLANALQTAELTEAVSDMLASWTGSLYVVCASLRVDSIKVTAAIHKGGKLGLSADLADFVGGDLSGQIQTDGSVLYKNPQVGTPVVIGVVLEELQITGRTIRIKRETGTGGSGAPIRTYMKPSELREIIRPTG